MRRSWEPNKAWRRHPFWGAYSEHRNNAKQVGVPFLLTFMEWLEIWETSGHITERGNRGHQYVMSRYKDKGPYAVGNVEIITQTQNKTQPQVRKKIGKTLAGRVISKEIRQKVSTTRKAKGLRPPTNLGIPHSAKTRSKISASIKAHWLTRRKQCDV